MSKHHAISRGRWQRAQRLLLESWKKRDLAAARQAAAERYLPALRPYLDRLGEGARVLEIGAGPIGLTRMIESVEKTYVDPLNDDYRRLFPGELDEGRFVTAMAEDMPLPDEAFDMVLCLDTLAHGLNPELMLNEIKRVMKPDALLLLSIRLHSKLEARLHYLAENWLPWLCRYTCPYYYARNGILNTLQRHFDIREEVALGPVGWKIPGLTRQECLFVCARKAKP